MGSSGGELWLPEPAIERIQAFLNTKEAARTTILSKSWYNVWLLRPNLDFVHSHHISVYYNYRLSAEENDQIYRQGMERFLEFAYKTLNRYEESNIKINSFRLCMDCRGHYYVGEWGYGLDHTQLILRALEISTPHLTLHFKYCLPVEVFFTSAENLSDLRIDKIEFEDPGTVSDILLSCPLIQKLSLHHLSLEKPDDFMQSIDGAGYHDNYPTDDTGYITKPLMRLTTLVLEDVYFDMLFLGDLSSKFPMLKDLTLFMTLKKHQEAIRISSTSLERLTFTLKNNDTDTRHYHPYKRQRVTLDFPSIRKFTFASSVIPLLSLESNSRGWESYLSITRRQKFLTASWFRRLSDFLTKLRRSRISLLLRVRSLTSFNYEVGDIQGSPTTEIENLIIDHKELSSLTCYALLDGLFRISHPKLITQCVSTCFRVKKKHIELLGRILLNGIVLDHEKNVDMLTRSHFMYGLNNLKEASAQIINKAVVSTWRDVHVPLDALLEHLKSEKGKQEVRFRLIWQQTTTTRKKFYLKMSNQKIQELDDYPWRKYSAIEGVKDECFMDKMVKTILENSCSGELVSKIKHLLKLLQDGFPESDNDDDANKFSCKLYEIFREPCFVNALRPEIEEYARYIMDYCGSPTERVSRMKADLRFKHTLTSLRSDTTNSSTIRVLLSILLGHWSVEGEFRELDKRLGENHFGKHFDHIAKVKAKSKASRRNKTK